VNFNDISKWGMGQRATPHRSPLRTNSSQAGKKGFTQEVFLHLAHGVARDFLGQYHELEQFIVC
jgi:hypothetical protein